MNSYSHNTIRRALGQTYPANEAANLARILCCEVLGQSPTDFYLGKDMELSDTDGENLQLILSRLADFEPIQYIQGKARFLCRDFRVEPGVLIPRPETEELVEMVLREVSPAARILDIGTGSGCIAVSLALGLPAAQVEAWDVSEKALEVARGNSDCWQAGVRCCLRDVLTHAPAADERFDVIVSNPPYVCDAERGEMHRNVLDWEPELALFVPDDDPLRFYRRIGDMGRTLLAEGGRLYFEINRAYGNEVAEMLRSQGYHEVEVRKDISHNDRFVIAER